ncbi:MAG: phage tail tape measure protein [Gammaproteobacteria bacterium]|nr:phage tail tape measure protein [Gammaproteobacteria bacterium]
MEALAAAGLNATQVMQALPPVLALAKAEGLSMDAAAEKLSDSLSVVGLGFDQAGRMADVLAKGANVSTTSASALAVALSIAGGIAKTAGMDLEGTVAALSALANAGIKGEKAGTALAAILTQLIDPASAASKELSALGITSRDFGEVIAQLKLKGDASNAAILAFGETAGPGLRALIQTGAEGVAALETQLRSADGAAEAAATGISGNLKGALSALQAAWANVKTALFDPVLEPLTKQAVELATALNEKLASGALKPVQDAIRAFADTGIKAGRDFVAGFDFNAALQSLQAFATGAKDAFTGIRDAGTTAASVVQIAWNGLISGIKTIGASLLAVASSAVSNIAIIEAAASKVGLGSLERAAELRQTANELAAKAGELTQSIAKDGEDIQGAFGRLAGSADGAADGIKRVADEQQRLADASPAAEIQEIAKSLDDYRGMAERANTAAAKARSDFESGKISAQDYGAALIDAADANADLAAATEQQTSAEKRASPERNKTAVELQAAEAKALAAQQTQQNTQQTQKNTEETEHHIAALKKDSEEQQVNIKHTNDGTVAAAGLANRLQELRGEMDKLSESARLYFEAQNQWNLSRLGIEGSAKAARDAEAAFQSVGDAASKALAGFNKEIAFAQEGIDQWKIKIGFATTGFEKFESAMELAALQTKKLWNEQSRDAEIARQSIERMTESGNIQMGVLKQAIQSVNGGFTLLDQQDLSGLQSAIDGANAKLREMQQEASDARDSIARLNAEIAAEQGQTEKAALLRQQLDYQQALAEIEAKRSQAELEGNRELVALYEEQVRKLAELNALKEKNIKADAKNTTTTSSSNASNTRPPAAQLPGGTGAAAQLPANSSGGITVNVNAGNARVLDNNFVEDLARQMQPTLARLTRLNA